MSIVTIIGLLGIASSNPIDYKDVTLSQGSLERFALDEAMSRNNPYIQGVIQKQLNNANEGKPIRYAYWVEKEFVTAPKADGSIEAPIQHFVTANESHAAPAMKIDLDPSRALFLFAMRSFPNVYSIVEIDIACTNDGGVNRASIGVYRDSVANNYVTFDPSFLSNMYESYGNEKLRFLYTKQYPLSIPKECYKSLSIPREEISKAFDGKNALEKLDVLLQEYWPFQVAKIENPSEKYTDTDIHKLFEKNTESDRISQYGPGSEESVLSKGKEPIDSVESDYIPDTSRASSVESSNEYTQDTAQPVFAAPDSPAYQALLNAYHRGNIYVQNLINDEIINGLKSNPIRTVYWVIQNIDTVTNENDKRIEITNPNGIQPFLDVSLDPSQALSDYIQKHGLNGQTFYVVKIDIECVNRGGINNLPANVYLDNNSYQLTYEKEIIVEFYSQSVKKLSLKISKDCYTLVRLNTNQIGGKGENLQMLDSLLEENPFESNSIEYDESEIW